MCVQAISNGSLFIFIFIYKDRNFRARVNMSFLAFNVLKPIRSRKDKKKNWSIATEKIIMSISISRAIGLRK